MLDESELPVAEPVASACELLGLDPLYLACEGRFLACVRDKAVGAVLEALRAVEVSADARVIGRVEAVSPEGVLLRSSLGTLRPLDWSGAEQLPRIC